ncbi:hypothetical protein AGDE_13018 [Angomonas deanei]|nr:hypothetical protein AGDE_13018 [Angomonas deanei]|eukprot:EPY22868.1 hypothetical protein AGDE_13018 [Angomonas deanei]
MRCQEHTVTLLLQHVLPQLAALQGQRAIDQETVQLLLRDKQLKEERHRVERAEEREELSALREEVRQLRAMTRTLQEELLSVREIPAPVPAVTVDPHAPLLLEIKKLRRQWEEVQSGWRSQLQEEEESSSEERYRKVSPSPPRGTLATMTPQRARFHWSGRVQPSNHKNKKGDVLLFEEMRYGEAGTPQRSPHHHHSHNELSFRWLTPSQITTTRKGIYHLTCTVVERRTAPPRQDFPYLSIYVSYKDDRHALDGRVALLSPSHAGASYLLLHNNSNHNEYDTSPTKGSPNALLRRAECCAPFLYVSHTISEYVYLLEGATVEVRSQRRGEHVEEGFLEVEYVV